MMRYQSFYPFARQSGQPLQATRQPGFGPMPMQMQPPNPRMQQARTPFGPGQGMPGFPQGGGPMGQPGEQQGGSKMEMYMQTANRFLNTAQQFAPLIQQFSPMLQNLPAMWKLYKGFQSIPAAGPAAAAGTGLNAAAAATRAPVNGPSVPRIFQPPAL